MRSPFTHTGIGEPVAAPPEGDERTLVAAMERAFIDACLVELGALKPGNVHIHAVGHGLSVADFERSALASAPAICAWGAGVGERILGAVEATRAAVGTNTNLGIILLAAPLMPALARDGASLRQRVRAVLADLTIRDAELAYRAIRLAAPAGLGRSAAHDVVDPPTVNLRDAMAAAAGRDRIARQYATGYEDIFTLALPRLDECLAAGRNEGESASAVHMRLLATFADSHILRKYGEAEAEDVRARAARLDRPALWKASADERRSSLLTFDGWLKAKGCNPGTTADLTVACLLAHRLGDIVSRLRVPGPRHSGAGT